MKQFRTRILVCLLPILVAAGFVAHAYYQYQNGEGGFRLGVDLVGGTILVYEIDLDKFPDRRLPESYKPEDLVARLKRRIDPNDLYNVTIRSVSNTRVELILPTGGKHQMEIDEQVWHKLLDAVREEYPAVKDANIDPGRGRTEELVTRLHTALEKEAWAQLLAEAQKKWPALKDAKLNEIANNPNLPELVDRIKQKAGAKDKEIQDFANNYKPPTTQDIQKFVDQHYKSGKKKDVTEEEVQRIKEKLAQVGSLEFRILANEKIDGDVINATRRYLAEAWSDEKSRKELESLAEKGLPPPLPKAPEGGWPSGYTYSWVELSRQGRHDLHLSNEFGRDPSGGGRWQQASRAREKGETVLLPDYGQTLLYSRDCKNLALKPEERKIKAYDYFLLTRDPVGIGGLKVAGEYQLVNVYSGQDDHLRPAVHFRFNSAAGSLFHEITSENRPKTIGGESFEHHLAIVLDSLIVSAPSIKSPIRTDGQISGSFTAKDVDQLVGVLRSGALPATLKPLPVSENTIGPTLGADTIRAGTYSVGLAFVAVLIFMLVYYRFAGFVACVALLANLLLTIGFMVIVQATFTLPGLAGLVLMLAMAVDANVLIYERLREERDRGASLALAIRNGYDRAFPTIIDTHLSSIFTAIVLYAVGNDQLKGFGVSLTAGLVISLFTSLYMTRLLFDIWLSKGWLHKLSMFRFFSRPNIDFMAIRYYWFTATILLTIFGITVFLVRGDKGLNIDFVGGTAYGGQLREDKAKDVSELRKLLGEQRQEEMLKVASVEQTDKEGRQFLITYAGGDPSQRPQLINLANKPEGDTPEKRAENVKARARELPDWSVEQIFLSTEASEGGRSRFFTIRTSEKEPELVQVTINRLLSEQAGGEWVSLLKNISLTEVKVDGRRATLKFSDFASPGYLKTLIEREFSRQEVKEEHPVEVTGKGPSKDGRYQEMEVELTEAANQAIGKGELKKVLDSVKSAFETRPQPDRLETFDKQLAADTQERAAYAILASWMATLLYLWFRFGNWTFGLATVLCLIHDLFFTLGIIAFTHYIHIWMPGVASFLMLQDFKIDLPAVAALLTLVGYSVNDTIVVFDRIREVRGKNPELTPQTINDSVNQTLSRTLLTSFITWMVVIVLYLFGGEAIRLFAFVMVVGVVVGTYSSIYIASPLLLIFGEGAKPSPLRGRPTPRPEGVLA